MKLDLRKLPKQIKAFWKEPPMGKYLNLKEILSLGGASLGISFIGNYMTMYLTVGQLPTLYNMGPNGSFHATLVYLIASIIGLIVTPIYGNYVQRTKTKWGRLKPYIMFLAPVAALFGTLALWQPGFLTTQTSTTIYVYALCIPALVIWQLWYNSWNLFPGVFTPNQQERTDVWSPIGLVIGFAPTIMNIIVPIIVKYKGDNGAARIMGLFAAIVGTALTFCLINVKERVFVTEEENKDNHIKLGDALKMIFKNKPLMILTLALVLGSMRSTIDYIWHIVARVKYATNMGDGSVLYGTLSAIVGFACTPNMVLLPLYTRKMNNKTIMMMWQVCNFAAFFILGIVGFQNFQPGTTSAIIITGLRFVAAFNAIGSLIPLMLSEIGDYQQNASGYRLDGFIQTMAYSVPTLATQALALIPALIQAKIGFNLYDYNIVEGSDNILAPDAVSRFEQYANIAVWISCVSSGLMLIALAFYPLSKKKHQEVLAQLKAKSVNSDEIIAEAGEGLDKVIEEEEAREADVDSGEEIEEVTTDNADESVEELNLDEQ